MGVDGFTELRVDLPEAEYYDTVDDAFYPLINELFDRKVVSLDTETTGLSKFDDRIKFWSMAWDTEDGRGRRMCLHHRLLPHFAEVFKELDRTWVFANAKYDLHLLACNGHLSDGLRCPIAGRVADVMVMHSLLYQDVPHDLKFMSNHVLGWTWQDFFDVFGKPDSKIPGHAGILLDKAFAEDPEALIEYASNDAWGTLCLYNELERQLWNAPTLKLIDPEDLDATLAHVYFEQEMPFTKVLWKCERRGAPVDLDHLERLRKPIQARLDVLARNVAQLTGGAVMNPGSTDKLRSYFRAHEAKLTKKTKGGKKGIQQFAMDEEVLKALRDEMEGTPGKVAQEVLAYRALDKIRGTYVEGILTRARDGIIYTNYNQHTAVTGRLSSSAPNLQNIPRADGDEFGIRKAFGTLPGERMLVADYDQLEMRMLAALAKEQDMLDIFGKGWDIHMGNASLVFDLPYDDIKKAKKLEGAIKRGQASPDEMTEYLHRCFVSRQDAKAIGFGQPNSQAEVKLPQNGEPYGLMPTATPCCTSRCSLSTCARFRRASTRRHHSGGRLVTSHASLTRGAGSEKHHRTRRHSQYPGKLGTHTLNYGMGVKALSKRLNCTVEQAQARLEQYMARYPAVTHFFENAGNIVRDTGAAFTLLGRRRDLKGIYSTRKDFQYRAERQGSNVPVQGSAADIVRQAMLRVDESKVDETHGFLMFMQVHDELALRGPKENTEEVKPILRKCMEEALGVDMGVRFTISMEEGSNWGEAK